MLREMVTIDESLCDGCGLCIPACAEGALRIVNGKARLVADRLCDGMGACLGHCPRGAIRVGQREADAFDETAVEAARGAHGAARSAYTGDGAKRNAAQVPGRSCPPPLKHRGTPVEQTPLAGGGCPGSRLAQFEAGRGASAAGPCGGPRADQGPASALTHWPVQLRLLPPVAPVLRGARLLVAADCVPVAYADFHAALLRDHAVVIACPKLDDTRGYVEKLADMIRLNDLAEITVVHMEVPCCTGILHAVLEARHLAESNVPVRDLVISIRGEVLADRLLDAAGQVRP